MIAVYFIVNYVPTDASPGYTVVYRTDRCSMLFTARPRQREVKRRALTTTRDFVTV